MGHGSCTTSRFQARAAFFQSKHQHLSQPFAAIPNQRTGVPVSMTAARSPPLSSVKMGHAHGSPISFQIERLFQLSSNAPPIDGCPPMLQQPDVAAGTVCKYYFTVPRKSAVISLEAIYIAWVQVHSRMEVCYSITKSQV
jgi:hypothetical protein